MKVGKYETMTELAEALIDLVENGTDVELDAIERVCGRMALLCRARYHVRKKGRENHRRLAFVKKSYKEELAEVRKNARLADRECPWLDDQETRR